MVIYRHFVTPDRTDGYLVNGGLRRADLRADETLDVNRFGAALDRVRAGLSPRVAG